MTEFTHCIVGASITTITTQAGKAIGGFTGECIGYTIGLFLSLASHLIIDRRVFEWGFWYNRGNLKEQILGSLDIIFGWITQLIQFILLYNWVLLRYMDKKTAIFCIVGGSIMGSLPDLAEPIVKVIFRRKNYQFPFHINLQTYQNTLTAWNTACLEGQIAIVFMLITGVIVYFTRR